MHDVSIKYYPIPSKFQLESEKKIIRKNFIKKKSKSLIKLSNNVHNCIKLCTYMNKYVKNIYTKFGLILLNRYGVNNFLSMQIEHHLGGEHGG